MSHTWDCPEPWQAEREGRRAGERGYPGRWNNPYKDTCEEAAEQWERGHRSGEYDREQREEEERAERRARAQREEAAYRAAYEEEQMQSYYQQDYYEEERAAAEHAKSEYWDQCMDEELRLAVCKYAYGKGNEDA